MKKITCYSPFSTNNLYSENVKKAITDSGYQVLSIRQILSNPRLFLQCKLINFNWLENFDGKKSALIQYIQKCLLLDLFKIARKKIVFTVHNKTPHELLKKGDYELRFMKRLAKKSDAMIGMCEETFQVIGEIDQKACRKIKLIPHPNYMTNYCLEETAGEVKGTRYH